MCDWNTFWKTIATVGTPLFLAIPKIRDWHKRKQIKKKLEDFFINYEKIKSENEVLYLQNLYSSNNPIPEVDTTMKFTFFKHNFILLNECENALVNGISIPKGYHHYKILSKESIKIEIISEDKITAAFIFKNKNVPSLVSRSNNRKPIINSQEEKKHENKVIKSEGPFQKIIKWKDK